MDKDIQSDETLKRYLLGQISHEEREQIEREYLANKDLFDQLLAVEDDLMDEYARGQLSVGERNQFEVALLATPRQREKLRETLYLNESMRRQKLAATRSQKRTAPRTSFWVSVFGIKRTPGLAAVFAFLLLFVSTASLFIRERRLDAELQRMQVERAQMQQNQRDLQSRLQDQQKEKSELQQLHNIPPTEPLKESTTTPTIATLVLPLISTRGDEGASFTLKGSVDMVHLQTPLANDEYNSYEAELQSADGVSVYKLTNLRARKTARGSTLLLRIPAKLLKGRNYVLKVSGIAANRLPEDAGFYSFQIVRN
ncbi:MAG: hypothetical protein ABJB61_07365 [bacterium]